MEDETVIEISEADAEMIERMAADGTPDIPDNTFSTYFDDEEKTLSVHAVNLKKETAWILVNAIINEYDKMAIDEEKRNWMKSVGIIEFPGTASYMYQFKGHDGVWLLTKEDIAKSTLEELQAMYEKDKEAALHSAEMWPGQKMRRVIY